MPGQAALFVLVVVLGSALAGRRTERWLSSALISWVRTWLSGPDRLRRALVRRSLWELSAGAADRGRLPDEVCVAVAPRDAARLTGLWSAMETDLVAGMRQAGERWSWTVPADVQVMFVEDPAVAPGHPVVHGRVAGRLVLVGPVCELISLDGRGPDISLSGPDMVIGLGGHAELRRAGSQWLVRDRGSANGVEVNGRAVDGDVPLLHNDEVALGRGGPRYVFSRLIPNRSDGPVRRGA